MLSLLFYILPIIIIGFIVYCDMEHGQTLNDYIVENDFEIPAILTCIPVGNLLVLIVSIGIVVWHFIRNLKKP